MAIDTSPSQLQQQGAQTLGSNIVNFLGLALRAQEFKAEAPQRAAQARVTAAHATGLEQQNSIFDNLNKKLPDLMQEYGEIKDSKGMFDFNAKYGNLSATPQGAKIMDFLNDTAWKTFEYETKTMEGQIKQAKAKYMGNLALRYPDLDLSNEADFIEAKRRAAVVESTIGGLPLESVSIDPATGLPTAKYGLPSTAGVPKLVHLQNERERLRASGDTQRLAEIEKAILNEQTETGEVIESTPGGGFRIVRGKGIGTAGQLTTGAATVAQTGLQKDLNAISSLDQAIAAAESHPEALGLQGKVRKVGEQIKGQLSPGSAMDTPVTDTQQKLGMAFSSIAQSLKVDSQLNRDELKMLKDVGDTLDFTEAPQTALNKLKNLRNLSYRNAVRKAKVLNQPTATLITAMPRTSLLDLFQSGDLTQAEVLAESARRDAIPP